MLLADIWIGIGNFVNLVGLVTFGISIWTWFRVRFLIKANERSTAPICILVINAETKEELTLPYKPRRDQLTRAELQGIFGFYFGVPRYDTAFIRRILHDGSFDKVIDGDDPSSVDETLRIEMPAKQFEKLKAEIASPTPFIENAPPQKT